MAGPLLLLLACPLMHPTAMLKLQVDRDLRVFKQEARALLRRLCAAPPPPPHKKEEFAHRKELQELCERCVRDVHLSGPCVLGSVCLGSSVLNPMSSEGVLCAPIPSRVCCVHQYLHSFPTRDAWAECVSSPAGARNSVAACLLRPRSLKGGEAMPSSMGLTPARDLPLPAGSSTSRRSASRAAQMTSGSPSRTWWTSLKRTGPWWRTGPSRGSTRASC